MIKRLLLGRRLASEEAEHQRLRKRLALPILASDPLSSNAYATEEILLVLIAAGTAGTDLLLPIGAAIAVVALLVIASYRQTVRAYPGGGGAYVVAKENLGRFSGLIAGGALLNDYVLTVAVSTTAGTFALASLFPALLPHRVGLSLLFLVIIMAMNLRGIRESGAMFALPTYLFFVAVLALIGFGFTQCLTDGCAAAPQPEHAATTTAAAAGSVSLFLILRAFASGCTILTGTEAIANGVPVFQGRRPSAQARNASATLFMLGAMTLTMFAGISILAQTSDVVPSHERSVISQIAEAVFGNGFGFFAVQITTALILILAANSAFQAFPRLASILGADRFLPRQFINLGDRLVFSNGIFVLAGLASILIIVYEADVTRLIQLYLIGVFTSFTLSQAGMVRHWRTQGRNTRGWKRKAVMNATGTAATGLVLVIIAVTKFTAGAWIVLVTIPVFVLAFQVVNRHYQSVGHQLRIPEERPRAIGGTHALVAVNGIDESVYQAIGYARAMRPRSLTAVHVGEPASPLVARWNSTGLPVPLQVIQGSADDPVDAIRGHVRTLSLATDEIATVILPEQYERTGMLEVLKRRRALRIKTAMLFEPRVAVTDVPVLATGQDPPRLKAPGRIISVVLVSSVHNATLRAIEYARSLSPIEVRAVVFNTEPETTMRILDEWITHVRDVALEAVDSPYRSVTRPLKRYVREIRKRNPDAVVNIVLPEFVVKKLWHQLLHNQTALQIKRSLLYEPGVVVTSVPFHLT